MLDVGLTSILVVTSLDKALYDDYPSLAALNKQQINWEEVKEATGKPGYWQTPKRIRTKYSANIAFS